MATDVRFTRLYPDRADGLSAQEVAGGIELPPRGDRPYVLTNMIASADGRGRLNGATKDLGHPADRALFHALRTIVDGVLVGAGTVRAEGYRELIREEELYAAREARGLEREPLLVVVSGSGDLPEAAPQTRRQVISDLDAVRTLGVTSLLCEGGPRLNAELLRRGLMDELHVVVATLLTGGEPFPIVAGDLGEPVRLELVSVHESGGYLFTRYAVAA